MLIYLDMCCLKRPFDDQSQPRIRLESEAVLGLLALESTELAFVRSLALVLENSLNPVRERASRVGQWLTVSSPTTPDNRAAEQRTAELMHFGFKNFDALHLASAEQVGADVFATCDDRLLAAARRSRQQLKVKVTSIVELAAEIVK